MALSLQRYTLPDPNSRFNHFLKERLNRQKQRSIEIAIEKLDNLPENVIVEILSWLPVKDLLQFKSVCKSWCSIISSPDFVSKHLNNYYYNNNDSWRGCLLVQFYVSHAELQLYELLVDETPRVLADEVLYDMPMYSSYVCGPCDGLYYVYQYDFSDRALWNPAINELKPLPELIPKPDLPSNLTYANNEVYGFGLDPVMGDYKVVVVKGHWTVDDDDDDDSGDVKLPVSVLVYSLRTDSWKYCGDLGRAYELERNNCYVYVNGCCYWLGSYEYSDDEVVIISFDMGTDAFEEIDVPDYERPSSKCLGIYDDSLALFSLHESKKELEIWTWNGVGKGWSKKVSVGPFRGIRSPIGHWKENRLLLQSDEGKLVLLDPDTQEMRDLGFQNGRWCEGAFAYMESLVSIKDKCESRQPEEVEAGCDQA